MLVVLFSTVQLEKLLRKKQSILSTADTISPTYEKQ